VLISLWLGLILVFVGIWWVSNSSCLGFDFLLVSFSFFFVVFGVLLVGF